VRSDREFIAEYRSTLRRIDPSAESMSADASRTLALTEICLRFLSRFLPNENILTVPFLMMGYPSLLDRSTVGREAVKALAILRHFAAHFGSAALWDDACRSYQRTQETLRCFDFVNQIPQLRSARSTTLLEILDTWLAKVAPWTRSEDGPAGPGEALVALNDGEVVLRYQIPNVPPQDSPLSQHSLNPRERNPPIMLNLDEMLSVAKKVDARECDEDWPADALPPLALADRLRKLRMERMGSGDFDSNRTITLDGAVHVVGMLSSGKSTLVLGILFALALGRKGKRVALLVSDTVQAATLADRLKRHGISATVLASFQRREEHLKALHWEGAFAEGSMSLSRLGQIGSGFSTACPLDGWQKERVVVLGREQSSHWPRWREKPCRNILPSRATNQDDGKSNATDLAAGVNNDAYDLPEPQGNRRHRLCPLFPVCPAQQQQRTAVDAQVILMTPAAFAYMTPDPWVLKERVTIPELLQYVVDLVIVDEVDAVQKELDGIFAPREPIMGAQRGVYVPEVARRSAEALRIRSGAQFGRRTIAKWQSNFHTLSKLVASVYGLLQTEGVFLSDIYQRGPFTAASILCRLSLDQVQSEDSDEAGEHRVLEVMRAASAIARSVAAWSISVEEAGESEKSSSEEYSDISIGEAASSLAEIARQVLLADSYEPIVEQIERMLDSTLRAFNSAREADAAGRRRCALAISLAVISDLILSTYNWLVKAQPGVANELGIEEVGLFRASPLIRHYRTLLPGNPARTVFGLLWEEAEVHSKAGLGGKLTLISHLGVGRHLIVHLHDLLKAEGQAGPHVLMMSGTSWAGGKAGRVDRSTGEVIHSASPCFDVQVPPRAVLLQPDAELKAIERSRFILVKIVEPYHQRAVRISGAPPEERRYNLRIIADHMVRARGGQSLIENHWARSEELWGSELQENRRRALFVVNSYRDSAVVANALSRAIRNSYGSANWKIFCLQKDPDDQEEILNGIGDGVQPLARSLIERFGDEPEYSILVAPIQIVSRGYNILNSTRKAAISSIYFIHRPHPHPDDLSSVVGRLNRFALERFEYGVEPRQGETFADRARRMRYAAAGILRSGLGGPQNYRSLSPEHKAQFAWDLLAQLWQGVGRGIRGGCPVFVGFIDSAFAPESFNDSRDTPASSALVQAVHQLKMALDSSNRDDAEVARMLYRPFYDALKRTEGLNYE
jgi:hypothetical protein